MSEVYTITANYLLFFSVLVLTLKGTLLIDLIFLELVFYTFYTADYMYQVFHCNILDK